MKKSVKMLGGRRIILYMVRIPRERNFLYQNNKMTTNYCNENKEIAKESHSNECHLSITNMT